MAELPKLLYIAVVDEGTRRGDERESSSFRYTRPVLQSTLQLMGRKARHVFKISQRVFEVMRSENISKCDASKRPSSKGNECKENEHCYAGCLSQEEVGSHLTREDTIPVSGTELIGKKQMAIKGFKAQSEMVIESLDQLITAWEERKESVVVEGVHLSLNFAMGLMKKHPSIIPFMIYIANEDKHMERFAVRAKYMTLDRAKNKYVKYIRNIRSIQEYLCNQADKHLVQKIKNTNVDRSVAAIHTTILGCLRRQETGEQLYDTTANMVFVIDEECRNLCAASSLSSKGMFQLIQRNGSSRHLLALINTDGSVAKAWPVESVGGHGRATSGMGSEKCVEPYVWPCADWEGRAG